MSILLDKRLRKNLLRPQAEPKWYVYNKKLGTVTEKDVAIKAANRTALNRKEIEMAYTLLRETVLESLLNGYTVKLGDWAYLYVTVNSDPADTSEEANASLVKRVKIHLRCDASFENELQKATFVTMDSLTKKEVTP